MVLGLSQMVHSYCSCADSQRLKRKKSSRTRQLATHDRCNQHSTYSSCVELMVKGSRLAAQACLPEC